MGIQELAAAFTARDWEEQREQLIGGLIHFIPAETDPQTVDPRELGASGSAVAPVVAWQEKLWWRDEDNVDDHDEITVIHLLDGTSYVTNDVTFPRAVESRTLAAEPAVDDSPGLEYGMAYRVPEGATGDEWPDHENEVAMWTARGWRYRPGNIGDLHYIKDEEGYEHFNASEAWEDGIGAFALQANSVKPNHLLIRDWQFENQTTTSPPVSGAAGETYIVGPAATGAWSGHDGKIAWRPATDAAFTILTPLVGEQGFDKNLGIRVQWDGTAWASAAGSFIEYTPKKTRTQITSPTGGSGNYSYSEGTAPTTSQVYLEDGETIAHAAAAAGSNKLIFRYSAYFQCSAEGEGVAIGLFRDSEVNAIDWRTVGLITDGLILINTEFLVDAPDASSHTYKIRILPNTTFVSISLQDRRFSLTEVA